MSYILDALKKSEQQRQRGATPTLHSVQAAPEAPPAQRPWLYPVLVLVLASAAYALGTMRPWRTEPAPDAPSAVAVAPALTPPAHEAAPPARPAPSPAADAPADASAASPGAAPSAGDGRGTTRAEPAASHPARTAVKPAEPPAREKPVVARQTPARKPAGAGSRQAAPAADPTQDQALTLAELPASLRAELPAMTITVHSFSPTAKERLLGVNNRLLREGDTLTPDLVLERITPDGMIFNFKGTRFQRGLR